MHGGRMEQCYLSLFPPPPPPPIHPSFLSSPQCSKQSERKKTKKRETGERDENRGRGRVSFFHPLNNGGMISAYPLITSLLFSPLLHPLLSLPVLSLSFFSRLEKKGCERQTVAFSVRRSLFFVLPLHLFVLPVIPPSLSSLSREGLVLCDTARSPLFFPPYHLHPCSPSFPPSSFSSD